MQDDEVVELIVLVPSGSWVFDLTRDLKWQSRVSILRFNPKNKFGCGDGSNNGH